MAAIVSDAIDSNFHCAIEAPSGLGKTWGYLVPLLLRSNKAIISTASHYLQEQLVHRDIPQLQAALNSNRSVAILKGRHNYLCPYYIKQHIKASGKSRAAEIRQRQLNHVLQQYRETGQGDIKAHKLAGDNQLSLSCSTEECLGSLCPDFKICPLMNARQQAKRADILIVNHSLLLGHNQNGSGSLIDDIETVVVDEAHSLLNFALQTAGSRVSSRQLRLFARRLKGVVERVASEDANILKYLERLEVWFASVADQIPPLIPYQRDWHRQLITQFIDAFVYLNKWFEIAKERDVALKHLSIQASEIANSLKAIRDEEGLCWVQKHGRGFTLQNTPVHLLDTLRNFLREQSHQAWILTSATLTVSAENKETEAEPLLNKTGISPKHFHRLSSPFNYPQQARLYLPAMENSPDQTGFYTEFSELLERFGAQCTGRILVLFSSYKALSEVQGQLAVPSNRQLISQADKRPNKVDNYDLVKQFQASPNAIMLATGSFWEGVDLSGAAISAVIIDKLPFSSPADPIVKLRSHYLERHGVNCFDEYLLPDAVIKFRQGCGRLLRREGDKGVIMLADSRVRSKDYGRLFLDALSSVPQCESLDEVGDFLA